MQRGADNAFVDRTLDVLRSLVAMDTVSRSSNGELLAYVETLSHAAGARSRRLGGERGECRDDTSGAAGERSNLLLSFGPVGRGGLLLAAHTDVVPPGPGWSSPPFDLVARDARAYGRGAADMKGFLAVVLAVLAEPGVVARLSAPLHVLCSYDEEIGCVGVRSALSLLSSDPHVAPSLVVIGEPTSMIPRVSHLGKAAYRVAVRSNETHSSRIHDSASAVVVASRLITSLDAMISAYRPRNGEVPALTANVGAVSGGTQVNVVAGSCDFDFEVRFAADLEWERDMTMFWSAVDDQRRALAEVGGSITITELTNYPGLAMPAQHPAIALAERICDAGPSGAIGFGTEGGLYAEALDAPVVICGPGDIADAHRPDEFVTLEQLDRCGRVLRALIDAFCGEMPYAALT